MNALILAAGIGARLRPFTNILPKCLMPIRGTPLLEYWLHTMDVCGIEDVYVNIHHHAELLDGFLKRPKYNEYVTRLFEPQLLGTAKTIKNNIDYFRGSQLLLVHADNLSCCDYREFIDFHNQRRPINAFMTMMTFVCPNPSLCGVVELDNSGIVTGFFEKVEHPPGDISNGAVYILEPEVIEWIANNDVYDFSLHVIPNWIGKISTWMNNGVHRDIGNIEMLVAAQKDECDYHVRVGDVWEEEFKSHKIHQLLADEVNNK